MKKSFTHLIDILNVLDNVIKNKSKNYALHEPKFTNIDKEYLLRCINSGYVSSVGEFVNQFEENIKKLTGSKHAIAVVNGTVALEMALRVSGIERDDEVFVPALTFVGTANAILHANGIPHFVDSDLLHFGINPKKLEEHIETECEFRNNKLLNKKTGRTISAIISVHVFGFPSNLNDIKKICLKYNLHLIEDAAEALGSFYNGKSMGTFGRLGIFSFNGNKIITTGGGGIIITNEDELAVTLRHITKTSKVKHKWNFFHDQKGWNFRMPNLNASLGCSQMTNFDKILLKKRELANLYKIAFLGSENFSFISEIPNSRSNYWLNTVKLNNPNKKILDYLMEELNHKGYNCRPAWTLLSELPMFLNCPKSNLSNSKLLTNSLINLPSSPTLI